MTFGRNQSHSRPIPAVWLVIPCKRNAAVRFLRGRPGKRAQEQVLTGQEKAEKEARKNAGLTALEEQREKLRRERLLQARQRWLEKQWLEEPPALKARFDYLQTMLSRELLSFYDPSGREYSHMSDCRNRTGGEWMRTLPVYDLEQVAAFYRDLWDARDRLTLEELEHAPDRLRGVINALSHRRLYLRLNARYQLTALGDRRDNLLERFREQDVHLILQPSLNEIVDLTNGVVYDLHVEEMGRSPLTDEIVGGEVTLVPAERG